MAAGDPSPPPAGTPAVFRTSLGKAGAVTLPGTHTWEVSARAAAARGCAGWDALHQNPPLLPMFTQTHCLSNVYSTVVNYYRPHSHQHQLLVSQPTHNCYTHQVGEVRVLRELIMHEVPNVEQVSKYTHVHMIR